MNLEELIDSTYNKYQAQLRAAEEARTAYERKQTEKAIAEFRARLDAVIQSELQEALMMSFDAVLNQQAHAFFRYKDVEVVIRYGPYRDGEWGLKDDLDQHLDHVSSERLVDYLLIRLGQIKVIKAEEKSEPQN